MNSQYNISSSIKLRESGLLALGVSLAIALVLTFFVHRETEKSFHQTMRTGREQLVRSLSRVPLQEGGIAKALSGYLQTVPDLASQPGFAYLVIRRPEGEIVDKFSPNGISVPGFTPGNEPSSWFSVKNITLQDSRTVTEFTAPLLVGDQQSGFIGLGFFDSSGAYGIMPPKELALLFLPAMASATLLFLYFSHQMRPLGILARLAGKADSVLDKNLFKSISQTAATRELFHALALHEERAAATRRELEGASTQKVSSIQVLQYKKARLETLLDALPLGIFVMDTAAMITYANTRVESFVDADRQTLLNQRVQSSVKDENVASFLSRYQGSYGRLHRREEMEFSPKHLIGKTILVSANPLIQGEQEVSFGTLVVFQDITAEALARQARGEFVAHVAHELKSPLNVLKMYSEMLLGDAGRDENFRVEGLNVIFDEVERLSILINNMLSISKIEMGSISLERQRIKTLDLLRDAFASVTRGGKETDLKFHLRLPEDMSPIFVDKDLMRVAINNLLTNAIKYNRPGGSVTMEVEETDERIVIAVKDTGQGIAPEEQDKIFDKFYRSEDPEIRQKPGHGLGLSLARSIVEIHHGKLLLESVPGKGSTFSIVLEKTGGLIKEGI